MRPLLHWSLTSAFIVALALPSAALATELEQRVRAAFLYNLAKFVEWPPTRLDSNQINICVLDGADFGPVLQDEIAGKMVSKRAVAIRSVKPNQVQSSCHILHIEESKAGHEVKGLLQSLSRQPVLTVGHPEDFIGNGGILRLKREQGRLRFEIALAAGQAAGLNFSSKLLRVATVVDDPDN